MPPAHTVVAIYQPHPEKEAALLELVRTHVPRLRELGLAADTPVVVLRSKTTGAILEIFDWKDDDAAETAHAHPEVQKIWNAYAEVSSFETLSSLEEAKLPFPHFERVIL